MSTGFIIMQIGNAELDQVCEKSIVPAIEAVGLVAKRVDKHNEGQLLKSEIIRFINEAEIIVADLTNERPNCYLEVGYAMGMNKFRNVILTVREDHFLDSPNHVSVGPKVHFDLGGYDILQWHPDALEAFRLELERRIQRRRAIINPALSTPAAIWGDEWLSEQRSHSENGLEALGLNGGMEIRFALVSPKIDANQKKLDEAASKSTIHTFGWPIAVYLRNRAEYCPKPRTDGIFAEIKGETKRSYDYWAIRRNGDFFTTISYFEDERKPGHIFFNTQIVRITEALLYCARLYSNLDVDPSADVRLAIRHFGLKERTLSSSSPERRLYEKRVSGENEIETELNFKLHDIESKLVDEVKRVCCPLFMLFDYFELEDTVYEDLVQGFVEGRVG